MTVQSVWRANGLQPHWLESFKVPADPQTAAEVRDIVGLYLSPPDKALALSVDEKGHIPAARPFVWTASAARIIRKVRHGKEALVTGH